MKKKKPQVLIGTSGWSYEHWKENFYPKTVKTKDWLQYYSQSFPTVEINSTFYRTPRTSTIENWYAQVPSDFSFSIKANRHITHQKRLHECEDTLRFFYSQIEHFKSKLGPILFQLPPSFKVNKERLIAFLQFLNNDYQHIFEFRHESWFNDEIYDLLAKHHVALCITDLNGHLSPEEVTSHFTYIRLHGPHQSYQGSYGSSQLKTWKKKIEQWAQTTSVYCYFDNDEKGYAIQDAKSLLALLQ